MTVSSEKFIYAMFLLADITLMLIALGSILYTSYKKMDEIIRHLSNCRAVETRVPFVKNGGPIGRLFMFSTVAGILITPRIYYKDNGADPNDVKNFPKALRRTIVSQYWISAFLFAFMVVLWAIGKYMNWLN